MQGELLGGQVRQGPILAGRDTEASKPGHQLDPGAADLLLA
jgi:hypothetical protein